MAAHMDAVAKNEVVLETPGASVRFRGRRADVHKGVCRLYQGQQLYRAARCVLVWAVGGREHAQW